ncbi:MAG TPA: hypothetical protein VD886_04985, partial [Herpetosiphonaceae bacterium]|nr:hypothetical protein [Herpetosiphonaceae bacterium]
MGAIWQLLYLNTTAPTETIVAALVQAAREKFDGQLGFTDYRVDRHLRCRNPQVLIGAEHIPPWGQRPLGMVVYSSFEGLTTVSLDMDGLNHFSDLRPEDLAGFDETKRTPYPGDEAHDCMLFCARLSELLETEVAFAVL